MRVLLLAALLLPAAGLAGCSGAAPADEPDPVVVTVPSGQMLDLRYDLASGAVLAWDWETADGKPVPFQLLHVDGQGRAQPLESAYAARSQGEKTAPQAGRYDFTWDNLGFGNVTVRFTVTPGYEQRLWPPGQGPGCAPALLRPC